MTGLPKRIMLYWDKPELPAFAQSNIASWRAVYPHYEIAIFDFRRALRYLKERSDDLPAGVGPVLGYTFRHARFGAMQSDIFRVAHTYLRGGLYADITITALRDLSDTVLCGVDAAIYRRWHGRINNGLVWATERCELMAGLLVDIAASCRMLAENNVYRLTGPHHWIKLSNKWLSERPHQLQIWDHDQIANKYVVFNQNLEHKKLGQHWSDVQDRVSVLRHYFGKPRHVLLHVGDDKPGRRARRELVENRDALGVNGLPVFASEASGDEFTNFAQALRALARLGRKREPTLSELLVSRRYRAAQKALAKMIASTSDSTLILSIPDVAAGGVGEDDADLAGLLSAALASMLYEHRVTLLGCGPRDDSDATKILENHFPTAERRPMDVSMLASIADVRESADTPAPG